MKIAQFDSRMVLGAYRHLKGILDSKTLIGRDVVMSGEGCNEKKLSTDTEWYYTYYICGCVPLVLANAYIIIYQLLDPEDDDIYNHYIETYDDGRDSGNVSELEDLEKGVFHFCMGISDLPDQLPENTYPESTEKQTIEEKFVSCMEMVLSKLLTDFEERFLPSFETFLRLGDSK